MAPTPSSCKQNQIIKTPLSKHRLNSAVASKAPNSNPSANLEHPIEVVGRIRDYPDRKEKPVSVLQANLDNNTLRVRADIGYRDFSLDGISLSEEEDLDSFYQKFVQSRINGVKLGDKCTIMMYGPTGSGKSHTMFGCSKQPGIVYRSLKDILGVNGGEEGDTAMFVHVTVLEIYNEEIYDLLSSGGGGGFGIGWPKGGGGSKVKLEVMGKKAKNASYISGTEAVKISKEIQKVEKRRIVKSTLCNDRSSRSHCMIILDVPKVGGRLMLVDMAGSENIDQAGQSGFEAKMQTAKINQGNIALKRVVESIANGDSHVPFRDSKLTMLLQDSFEDDKSKILMILCASPDPKEIHKTICTLEYGAKAKCIVRGPHTPSKDTCGTEDSSAVILGSRIQAMDQFIHKLQMENKLREKEKEEAHRLLMKKEEEVAKLRALIEEKESAAATEEEIEMKVGERTKTLKEELEKKLAECQRMAEEFVESERRRMEEKVRQQQLEVEMLKRRLEEIELELSRSREGNAVLNKSMDGSGFARRLIGVYTDEDMVKSMDLDTGDDAFVPDAKYVDTARQTNLQPFGINNPALNSSGHLLDHDVFSSTYGDKVGLSTVYEEEEAEEEDEDKAKSEDEEVEKMVIEVKNVVHTSNAPDHLESGSPPSSPHKIEKSNLSGYMKEGSEMHVVSGLDDESRRLRIQNIFTLCGYQRELSQQHKAPIPVKKEAGKENSPILDLTKTNGASLKPTEHTLPLTSMENRLPLTPSLLGSAR